MVESDPPSPGLNLGATSASVGEALLTADPTAARLVCEPARTRCARRWGRDACRAGLHCRRGPDGRGGRAAGITRLTLRPRSVGWPDAKPSSSCRRPRWNVEGGLRGITSVRGHAVGADVSVLLSTDQALVDLCAALGRPDLANLTGAGACGGVGAAVLASVDAWSPAPPCWLDARCSPTPLRTPTSS